MIILTISFLGEILKAVIPLPIPASIYGLLLMLTALVTGIVPVDSVRRTAEFLIEIMPMMFIPAGVGLMESWGLISGIWIQVVVVIVVSTFLVMTASGRVTQSVIRAEKRGQEHGGDTDKFGFLRRDDQRFGVRAGRYREEEA